MSKARDVSNLLNELHEKKILNLDTSLKEILRAPALDSLDPSGKVSTSVVAWDGYGLVIKGNIASIAEVAALGQGVRQQLAGQIQKTTQGE